MALLAIHPLCAEVIAPDSWMIENLRHTAISNYTQEGTLRNFVDIQDGKTLVLKHSAFVVRSIVGSTKACSGKLNLSFRASSTTGAETAGKVMITMYGYHFREDNCIGKIEPVHWEEQFSVSGEKDISFQFPITEESLLCGFCDEQVPTFRFFITFALAGNSPGLRLDDIAVSTEAPLAVFGKKQMGGASWLMEGLEKDKANAAARDALHDEQAKQTVQKETSTVAETPARQAKPEPKEIPVAMEQFVDRIEAKMPALFDGCLKDGALVLEKNPSNGFQSVVVYLNPPEIPEGYEVIVTVENVDQNAWVWCKGVYDKDGRPLVKASGHLADGTMIMRLPRECRRLDFKCGGNQNAQGVIGKVFYRKLRK